MRIFNGKLNGETVGGEFEGNITHLNCLCHQVLVNPATESTEYDIEILNSDGSIVYERTAEAGFLSELTSLPMLGTYTIKILNATKDEAFSICLVAREE